MKWLTLMQKSVTKTSLTTICPLYRIVFDSRYVKTAVFVLLASMFVQPISLAYAAELTVDEEPVAETVSEEVPAVAEENSESIEEIAEIEVPSDPQVDDVEEISEVQSETESDIIDEEPPELEEEIVVVATTTTESTATTTVVDHAATTSESQTETITDEEEEQEEQIVTAVDTDVATSTEVEPLVAVVENNDNYHQFSKEQCVAVGDGSFYCGEAKQAKVVPEDSFYTALDHDGDQEIFARIDGEVTQITSNTLDDAAPYYDQVSETLVWHRAIDERYQIVSYDMVTGEELVLTDGRVNNMQPSRYGDITVWQQWGENSWEIMLLEDGEITRLTNDVHHDIAPSIRGEYILWRTNQNDAQVMSVYTIATGQIEIIADGEVGMSVSNPRMVLVYDGYTENGDRVTRGYDPETGDIIPLSSAPAPMPATIPDSEPVKETRALIQVKSPTGRDELDTTGSDLPPTPTATSTPDMATSTLGIADIDLTQSNEVMATSSELEIPDVIVPPVSTTTPDIENEQQENPDFELVIPPTSTSTAT